MTAAAAAIAAPACPQIAGYAAAPLSAFRTLPTTVVDLFVAHDERSGPRLYCPAGREVNPSRLTDLVGNGVSHLLVRDGDFAAFSDQLLQSLEATLQQDAIPPAERFAALQTAVAAEFERALQVAECTRYCDFAKNIGRQMVELLAASDVVPQDLFRLARHDFRTFTHVTNVASYSVILAERLGHSDPAVLNEIAYGAMLHDLGKRFIPARILAKPGRLTAEERVLVESHPTAGFRELRGRPDVTQAQLMMVYQHHERVDGGGYPVGVPLDEIHPWARLLAVVDVFDAVTAIRPYRRPATRSEALEYQQSLSGTHFDAEMLQCWVATMS